MHKEEDVDRFIRNAIQNYYRNLYVEGFSGVIDAFGGEVGALSFLRNAHELYVAAMKKMGVPEDQVMGDGYPAIQRLYKNVISGKVQLADGIIRLNELLEDAYGEA